MTNTSSITINIVDVVVAVVIAFLSLLLLSKSRLLQCKPRVVTMAALSSLTTPVVVVMATSSTVNEDKDDYAFQNIVCNVAAFCSNPNVLTHFSWPRNALTGHGICLTFDPKQKTRTKSYLLHCFLLHIKAVRTHDSQPCQAKCIELPVNRYAHSKHT